ncbi:hypothetical protein Rsub_11117 [Raphidocelis subcapitata]|uniref:Uncharacterized protein n=1 Tax=Raphidocelis subcapitata TaxID=307507 RepID=A0A2V0PDT9_9CHLO|nr:hypothetical protein Rsub_11117 [Raphidocelis subcapitata]|eukprot:GBF98006.1 hypothetical protein Rsub_11117 [Raphidocelis subcapitata]
MVAATSSPTLLVLGFQLQENAGQSSPARSSPTFSPTRGALRNMLAPTRVQSGGGAAALGSGQRPLPQHLQPAQQQRLAQQQLAQQQQQHHRGAGAEAGSVDDAGTDDYLSDWGSEDEDEAPIRGQRSVPLPRNPKFYAAMVHARAIYNAKLWAAQA